MGQRGHRADGAQGRREAKRFAELADRERQARQGRTITLNNMEAGACAARARAPRQALQDTFTLTNAQLQAELAVQDQKAWGFSAKVQDEMPHFRRRPMRPFKEYPARHMHKVFRPPRQMAPGSPDTVAFDSDIEDPEVLASMRLPEPEEVAEAAPEAEAEAEVADAEPLEPVEAAVAAPEAAEPLEAAEAVEAEAEAAPEAEVPETAPEAAPEAVAEAVAEAAAEAVAETLQAETEAAEAA